MKQLRVGVIFGGMSSEKEVSLNSGRNVYDNIDKETYCGVPIFMDSEGGLWILPWQLISQNTTTDISEHLANSARRISYEQLQDEIDFAFIALHGKYGDDGCIQGLLELLKIPYTGPGVLASAIGMDKHLQQKILKNAGINVPRSMLVREEDWQNDPQGITSLLKEQFTFPLFIKPTREGSSVGVSMIDRIDALETGIIDALRWDNSALVEEYVEGLEFSAIVIEENESIQCLGLTEIQPQSRYFTYDDKYMPGRCRKFTPPKNIPLPAVKEIQEEVIRAFKALGFRSYGRIDGFFQKDGRILITDPNSSSGMAPSSFFFEQAACAGLIPSMIISQLIENALLIHKGKNGPL